jgi:hypothetical protein
MDRDLISKIKNGFLDMTNLSGGELNDKYRDLKQNLTFEES